MSNFALVVIFLNALYESQAVLQLFMITIAVFEINTSLKIAIHDIDVDSMMKKRKYYPIIFPSISIEN